MSILAACMHMLNIFTSVAKWCLLLNLFAQEHCYVTMGAATFYATYKFSQKFINLVKK